MTKTCTVCKVEKPLDAYYETKRGKYGRESRCKPCFRALNEALRAQYKERNAERIRESNLRNLARLTPEKKAEYGRRYRAKHGKVLDARNEASRAKKPEHHRTVKRAAEARRRKENPAAFALAHARRRARIMGAPISDLTLDDWRSIKMLFEGRCAYCGIVPRILSMDHVVPLVAGGSHTKANIVPACMPCNVKKKDREAPPFHPDFSAIVSYLQ